jgi:hypothetical protein
MHASGPGLPPGSVRVIPLSATRRPYDLGVMLSTLDERVLLDGLDPEARTASWSAHGATVDRLAFLGLIRVERVPQANGTVMTIPLALTNRGARIALDLQARGSVKAS